MIPPEEVRRRIEEAIPEARVVVRDLTGGGDHYQVDVVSPAFTGKSRVERHRMIYDAFGDVIGGALHALSIQARTPEE